MRDALALVVALAHLLLLSPLALSQPPHLAHYRRGSYGSSGPHSYRTAYRPPSYAPPSHHGYGSSYSRGGGYRYPGYSTPSHPQPRYHGGHGGYGNNYGGYGNNYGGYGNKYGGYASSRDTYGYPSGRYGSSGFLSHDTYGSGHPRTSYHGGHQYGYGQSRPVQNSGYHQSNYGNHNRYSNQGYHSSNPQNSRGYNHGSSGHYGATYNNHYRQQHTAHPSQAPSHGGEGHGADPADDSSSGRSPDDSSSGSWSWGGDTPSSGPDDSSSSGLYWGDRPDGSSSADSYVPTWASTSTDDSSSGPDFGCCFRIGLGSGGVPCCLTTSPAPGPGGLESCGFSNVPGGKSGWAETCPETAQEANDIIDAESGTTTDTTPEDSSDSGSSSGSGPDFGCCFRIGLGSGGVPCCLNTSPAPGPGGLESCRFNTGVGGKSGWAETCPETAQEANDIIDAESGTTTDTTPEDSSGGQDNGLNFVDDIYPLLCSLGAQHGHGRNGRATGLLDMSTARKAYDNTVNVASRQQRDGMPLILPCHHADSYLWHKLAGSHTKVGGSGGRMPPSGPGANSQQLAAIADWIDSGARYSDSTQPSDCGNGNSGSHAEDSSRSDSTTEGPSSENAGSCPSSMEAWDASDRRCTSEGAVCSYDQFCCCPNEEDPARRGPCTSINNLRCRNGVWEIFYGEQPPCAYDPTFKCPSDST